MWQITSPRSSANMMTSGLAILNVPSGGACEWNAGPRRSPAPDCSRRFASPMFFSSSRRAAGDAHQRIEALRRIEQVAAHAGKDDRAAIEHDCFLGEVEGEPRMLLDKHQGQIVFVFEPAEPGEQHVDDYGSQA